MLQKLPEDLFHGQRRFQMCVVKYFESYLVVFKMLELTFVN